MADEVETKEARNAVEPAAALEEIQAAADEVDARAKHLHKCREATKAAKTAYEDAVNELRSAIAASRAPLFQTPADEAEQADEHEEDEDGEA